ncbi:MAG: ribosome silencing factor [Coriobacteriales bacterium]
MTEHSAFKEQALVAARAIDEKKGSDIVIQDVSDLLNVTDYFVICTAANNRRVDAIAEEVEEQLFKEFGIKPASIEGLDESEWVLMDYGSIVVHIFQPGPRDYYRLEQLWDAAPTIDVALAGIEDPAYTERIASLLERAASMTEDAADED